MSAGAPTASDRGAISLAPRLIVMLLVPIVACFAAFGFITVELRRRAMMDEADHEARDHGTTLQVALDEFLRDHRIAEMDELTEALSRGERIVGVLVFDRFDQLATGSGTMESAAPVMLPIATAARIARRGRSDVVRLASGRQVFAYAFPLGLSTAGPPRGTAVLMRDLEYVADNTRQFARELALGCLALMLLVAGAAFFGLRSAVLGPLRDLLRGVERVASGDLASPVRANRDDEMGRIAEAFNRMMGSLGDARAEISAKNEANLALERRLQHAQRLALIGQMSASLAHQIGSPLNVVLGRARYALKQGGQSARDRKHFDEIVAGGEAISAVVERLLGQARRVRGPATRVDLAVVAKATLRFLESECERSHVRATLEAESDVCVNAVRTEVEQVLLNLCMNAIQAQPDGGRLAIRVRRVVGDAGETIAELSVADAGPGIPVEARERVFEAFYTTKEPTEGTGLGLAICDEIVRRLGGTIVASAEPDGGALFRVSLPEV